MAKCNDIKADIYFPRRSSIQRGDVQHLFLSEESGIKFNKRNLTQEKSSMPKNLKDHLLDFYVYSSSSYKHIEKLKHINKYKLPTKTFKMTIKNSYFKKQYQEMYHRMITDYGIHCSNETICKYTNAIDLVFGDDYISYKIYDQLGNIKSVKESYEAFYKYYKKICKNEQRQLSKAPVKKKDLDISLVLTNNITKKLDSIKLNKPLGVCQSKQNVGEGSYAQGYFDYFINGAMYIVMIYVNKKLVGRSASRIVYDEDNNEYLFLERIYILDSMSQHREDIIGGVFKELSKHYKLLTSNMITVGRENDYEYILKNLDGVKYKKLRKGIFRGPKRELLKSFPTSYYKDSLVFTVSDDGGKTYYDMISPEKEIQSKFTNDGNRTISSAAIFLIN